MKKWYPIYGLMILLVVSFAWGQTVTNPYPVVPQSTSPGTAQSGNINVTGTIIAGTGFSGPLSGSATSLKSPATTGLLTATGMGAGTTRAKTVRDANDTILELGGSYTPSATWNWTSATVTWPTFNQSTTGTAAHGTTWGPYAGINGPTQARTFTLPDADKTLAASDQSFYIGTTSVAINRTSAALSLAGVSIDGSAGTVTNGVYTNAANSMSLINPLTTLAESWIGPSTTTGIYFKGGNVGIGTTNPTSNLSIAGTSNIATISTGTTDGTDNSILGLAGGGARGSTRGAYIDLNGNEYSGGGAIDIVAGNVATGDIRFATAGAVNADVIIKNGGNVGIGTTSPRAALDIYTGYLVGSGLQLPHIINKVASANIHNSHDAVATSTALAYAKAKTIKITNGLVGQQRFLFDIKTVLLGGATAYGKIYRNGVALGTEQTDVTGGYVTKSQDITQTWNPGDTCELWIYTSDAAQAVSVQNFRIAYDDSPTVAVASTNTTP